MQGFKFYLMINSVIYSLYKCLCTVDIIFKKKYLNFSLTPHIDKNKKKIYIKSTLKRKSVKKHFLFNTHLQSPLTNTLNPKTERAPLPQSNSFTKNTHQTIIMKLNTSKIFL